MTMNDTPRHEWEARVKGIKMRLTTTSIQQEDVLRYLVSYLPAETLRNVNAAHRVFFDEWMKTRYKSLTFAKNDKQLLDRLR